MINNFHSQPSSQLFDHVEHSPAVMSSSPGELIVHPGGAPLILAALSPREKGFFNGIEGGSLSRSSMQQFYDCLATGDLKKVHKWMSERDLPFQQGARKKKFDWLRELPTRLAGPCASYLKTGEYDYFSDLKQQYRYYRAAAAQGHYSLAVPGVALNKNETEPPSVLFSVNGIHALGVGNPEDDGAGNSEVKPDISLGKIKSRIQQLKGEETLDDQKLPRWEHPPFLFQLAQNFSNGFFGHARSLPDQADSLFDQRRHLNKGVMKAAGYEIVRELLGLDETLRPTGSRRILVDMAHLSAASRNDLYEKIFRTYNKNIDPLNPIPVVFTGAAYSGIDYLIEMIKNAHDGIEHDNFRVDGYYGAGINLSDEDVLAVFWSQGLISLTLEARRLGNEMGGIETMFSSARTKALRLLARQISGIISIPFAYHISSPLRIWDSLCIGQAMGEGNTLLEYFRCGCGVHIEKLKEDLEEVLSKIKKEEPMWFGGYKPCVLAEKICHGNLLTFASRHF